MDRVQYESLIIQEFVNLEKVGSLNVKPWYQRRSVWSEPQKSYLVNTLLEQKPIPAIYIRHTIDLEKERSIREVVDGQQRITSVLEYVQDEFSSRHPDFSKRVRFSELNKSQKESFLLTSLPIAYLLGATDSDVIDIFGRINSVSKNLNPQEKRNAQFSGEFKQFCLHQASSRLNFWRKYDIFSANDIARMTEFQFVSDLVLNLINGLSDFSSARLNAIYKANDSSFPEADQILERLDRIFNLIVDLEPSCIKETVFSRQPLFFSLCIVLDSLKKPNAKKVENGLFEIDARFKSEENQSKEDIAFVTASSATVQRIRQRKVRDQYIRGFIG